MSEKRKKYAIIVKGKASFTRTLNQLFKKGFVYHPSLRLRTVKDVFEKDSAIRFHIWTNALRIYINSDAECKMVLLTQKHVWLDGRTYKTVTLAEFLKKYEPTL